METGAPAASPSGIGVAPVAAHSFGKGSRLSIVMPPSPPASRPATREDGQQSDGLETVAPSSPRPSVGGNDRTPRRSSGGTPREGRPPLARQSSSGGGRGAFGSSAPRFSGAADGEGSRSGRLSRGDGERGRSPSEAGGGDSARQPRVSGSAGRPPRRLSATGVALSDARREQLAKIEKENAELMARLASLRTRDEAVERAQAGGGSSVASSRDGASGGSRGDEFSRSRSGSRGNSRGGSRGKPRSGLGPVTPPTPRTPRTPKTPGGRIAVRSPADAAAAVARLRAERALVAGGGGSFGIRSVAKEVGRARQRAVVSAADAPAGGAGPQRTPRRSVSGAAAAPEEEESPAAATAAAGGSVRAVAAALELGRRNSGGVRRTM